jgi:hypothetical protein
MWIYIYIFIFYMYSHVRENKDIIKIECKIMKMLARVNHIYLKVTKHHTQYYKVFWGGDKKWNNHVAKTSYIAQIIYISSNLTDLSQNEFRQ